jgi:orotidine-5'-phosphate decarboxylase
MTRQELVAQIRRKQSFLCVGLDTDPAKLPAILRHEKEPVLTFNRAIIEATQDLAVSYKPNLAFYEAMGPRGWDILQATREAITDELFTIADAKRGDIGNTANAYAQTFFHTYAFDSVTVNPYMGSDSVKPFLQYPGKWAIVLGLTSNPGAQDIQYLDLGNEKVYEATMRQVAEWGTAENTMFVVGATRPEELRHIRSLYPTHFMLVPGVGAQGGSLETVYQMGANADCGLLVNASRSILYASSGSDFAEAARAEALRMQREMAALLV